MPVAWQPAPTKRAAYFADVDGDRLFVEQTVCGALALEEIEGAFNGFIAGVRVGSWPTVARAMAETAAIKKARLAPGFEGLSFDY